MNYLGLMQQGKENHLISDHQVADLIQVPEQVMDKEKKATMSLRSSRNNFVVWQTQIR